MKKLILLLTVLPFMVFGQETMVKSRAPETLSKPDSAATYMMKANRLREEGKIEEAMNSYRKACEFQPSNEDAFKGWFGTSIQLYGVLESGKVLDQWIELDSTNITAWNFKGIYEAETGNPEGALKAFEKAVEIQPDSAVAWVGIGQMRYEMKRYDEALEAFNNALEVFPERSDVWGMKAATLARLDKFDDAFAAISKAIEISPGPNNIYNRACLYSIKGEKANALADLKEAISLNPQFKRYAPTDEDFKSLWNDPEFIALMK